MEGRLALERLILLIFFFPSSCGLEIRAYFSQNIDIAPFNDAVAFLFSLSKSKFA